MRIKVESVAPLPHIKAWFSTSAVPTILDLKTSLCSDLPLLHHGHVRPGDILLLLDDFELLDSSPIDVVRDGDLVVIKKASAPPSTKRKFPPPSPDVATPARKRAKTNSSKAVHRTPQPSNAATRRAPSQARAQVTSHYNSSDESSDSSSSDSSSDYTDSSEDSSDSDSDSTSSTDSDSDSTSTDSDDSSSSSSSASSDAPSIKTSRKPTTNGTKRTNAATSRSQLHKSSAAKSSAPPVPPGLGKPATHSRNLRRRRKKMYERLSLTAEPASVNDIPLGTRATTVGPTTSAAAAAAAAAVQSSSHTITPTSPSQHPPAPADASTVMVIEQLAAVAPAGPAFMMASLQNKNKRRGFKSALSHGVPPKIVFDGAEQDAAMDVDASADPDAQVVEAALGAEAEAEAAQPSPPLARAHGHAKLVPPSRKQARGLVPPNMFVTSVDVEEGLWPVKSKYKNKKRKKRAQAQGPPAEEEDPFAQGLPYDDVPESAVAAAGQGEVGQEGGTERAAVAARWDTLRKVTDKAQVQVGTTLAWKALGINFATLTPEMLLHVGGVLRCDEQLIVEPMAEPGMAEASFGAVPDGDDGGPAEEAFEWTDVLQGDWRLVPAR